MMEIMTESRWSAQLKGDDCAFCMPRDDENKHWQKIRSLNVSTLYLNKIQGYYGYSLLIFDKRHAIRASQLEKNEWALLCEDLRNAQIAIESVVNPDHINIEALGNQTAHLHWHIFPRYRDDPRWGWPIWTTTEEEMQMTVLPKDEFNALAEKIREALA